MCVAASLCGRSSWKPQPWVCRPPRVSLFVLVLAAAGALLCTFPVQAVPAAPEAVQVAQPDGAKVTVRLRGDEFMHWYEDANGYPVAKVAATGAWVYARQSDGQFSPTEHVLGRVDPEALGLQKTNVARLAEVGAARRGARAAMVPDGAKAPTIGTMHNLVVLANFTDLTLADDGLTRADFESLFNVIGYTADGAAGSRQCAILVQGPIAGRAKTSSPDAAARGSRGDGGPEVSLIALPRENV